MTRKPVPRPSSPPSSQPFDTAPDLSKVTADVASELSRCADLLAEAQECIADLMPLIRNPKAITGIQRIDLATQVIQSLEHVTRAVADTVGADQTLPRDEVTGGPILQEIADKVWKDDATPKAERSEAGAIQWF